MQLLDLTLPSPAANLALDEALIDQAEAGTAQVETLRIWHAPVPAVVIGRASQLDQEVNLPICRSLGVPVLRRTSGGAAIVCGPGCLMYALVLSTEHRPQLKSIHAAHQFVLGRLARSLAEQVRSSQPRATVEPRGTSDLAYCQQAGLRPRKFSGNSLHVKRNHLLYHGTLLYDFPLELIAQCLRTAPRQPEYRAGREHGEFIVNLPLSAEQVRSAVLDAFPTERATPTWPQSAVERLVADKYSRDDWNHRR